MNHRIRRGTVRRDTGTVEGMDIVGIDTAKFISLVKSPANQRAFSVVRSEDGKPSAPRIGRTKRNDAQQITQVTFPVAYTDEQVQDTLKTYGLAGFEVTRDDTAITAAREGVQSIATDKLTSIKLTEDGITAQVMRSEEPVSGKNQLVMTQIEFSSDTFSRADAVEWLGENQVDFEDKALDNSSGNFVLQRADAGDGESRQMELAPGVVASITRSDLYDVPEGFVLVVNEAAWCGWGWGALDFDSKLAGIHVGEKIREGLCLLDDILRDILFYSHLPIDSRKELAQRSLHQFGVYAGTLLDQLPRQLLIQVGNVERNDPAKEPTDMTTTTKNTEADNAPVTRADVKALLTDVLREAGVIKAEPAAGTEPAAVEPPPAAAPSTTGLTREDLASVVSEALKPVTERLDKVESTVVVRTDANDPVVEPPAALTGEMSDSQKKIQREDKFKGTMPALFG